MVPSKGEPPVAALYHWIAVPVAVKLATVAELQNAWVALPVGAAVVLRVTATCNRAVLSQLFRVWLAK